jgi:imidazolonepropionase-like amidohydrolase
MQTYYKTAVMMIVGAVRRRDPRRAVLLLSLALAVCAARLAAQTPRTQITVLRAARMIDGTGAAPIVPAMIRIEDDRIVEVGTSVRIPPGARMVDLGDATLLPGLIDLHTHLTGDERVHWEDALVKSTPPRDALWGARNARITLMAGFTSVRDMGPSWPYVDVELRRAIDDDAVPGPRMMVAGNYISSTGGAGDARQFSIYVDVPLVRNLADGADEVTKAVRTNLKNGADFIKILATGAMLSKGISPGAQQYSDAEIRAAVVEARRWGKWVASHAHGADGIKASIRAGVRTVDHGSYLDDEAVGLLKASNRQVFYVPTLYTYAAIDRAGGDNPSRRASASAHDRSAPRAMRASVAPSPRVFRLASPPTPPSSRTARMRRSSPNA